MTARGLLLALFLSLAAPAAAMPINVIDNRAFVEVRLNGNGPFHFVLDSGGLSIISTSLTKRLGLRTYEPFEGRGVGEKPIPAEHCDVADIEIGGEHLRSQKIAVADLDDIKRAIGFEAIDGLIGYELFSRYVDTIDYAASTLTLTSPDAYSYPRDGIILPISMIEHVPVVQGSIARLPASFSLDTGDRWWLTLHTPFVAGHHLLDTDAASLEAITGWGGGGPVPANVTRLGPLALDKISLGAQLTRFPLTHGGAYTRSDISGSIGAGILRHMRVTFDYPAKRVVLENLRRFDDQYDRSGMWLTEGADGFGIESVVKNGPSAQAGIVKNDRVIAIDGVSAEKLFLPTLRDRLCDPHLRSISLTIRRGANVTTHEVHLRDLVR